MANDFYNHAGYPANSADGKSVDMRAELLAITAGFNKMPIMTANPNRAVITNTAGTGLTVQTQVNQDITTWTPVLTCATPGNLTIAYSEQFVQVFRFGGITIFFFAITTSTFTHTTASGSVQVTGFPSPGLSIRTHGTLAFSGLTKAGYTQFVTDFNGGTQIGINACGSAVAQVAVAITDFPTAGTVVLRGTIIGPTTT